MATAVKIHLPMLRLRKIRALKYRKRLDRRQRQYGYDKFDSG